MSWYDIQELFWISQHGLIELLLMAFLAAGVLLALVRAVTASRRKRE